MNGYYYEEDKKILQEILNHSFESFQPRPQPLQLTYKVVRNIQENVVKNVVILEKESDTKECTLCCQSWNFIQKNRLVDEKNNGKYAMYQLSNCNNVCCFQCLQKHFEQHNLCPFCRTTLDELIGIQLKNDPFLIEIKMTKAYEDNYYYSKSMEIIYGNDWSNSGEENNNDW